MTRRAGAILAVADVGRSVAFYRDRIGFEVEDARAEHRRLEGEGVRFLAEPYEPPWGGCRFFCVDPDGYLVEIEETA
jgi:catechol 2,3-dioxygenase-like lactoylglutathione lyase family enzyme